MSALRTAYLRRILLWSMVEQSDLYCHQPTSYLITGITYGLLHSTAGKHLHSVGHKVLYAVVIVLLWLPPGNER